MVDNELLHSAI